MIRRLLRNRSLALKEKAALAAVKGEKKASRAGKAIRRTSHSDRDVAQTGAGRRSDVTRECACTRCRTRRTQGVGWYASSPS